MGESSRKAQELKDHWTAWKEGIVNRRKIGVPKSGESGSFPLLNYLPGCLLIRGKGQV
jgi:hypothetical protein